MRLKVRLPNWPWARLGVRAKLILSFLAVLVPAFLLLVLSDYQHYAERRASSLAHGCALGEAAATLLRTQIDGIAGGARLIFSSPEPDQQPADVARRLEEFVAAHPGCINAFLLDAGGQLVAAAPPGQNPVLDPGLVAQAASAPGPLLSDLFPCPPDSRPAVQVLVPGRSGDSAGLVGLTLDAQAIGSQVDQLAQGTPFAITLCDRRGQGVYSTVDPNLPWDQRDWSVYAHIQEALGGQTATVERFVSHLDGQALSGAAVPVPEIGWVVSTQQPALDTLGYLRGQLPSQALPFVALAAFALLAAAVLQKGFTSPLTHLAEHARALGRGQLNERIEVHTGDQFEELAAALNSMAGQIEERDRRLRARSAELDAIITQSAEGIAIHGPEGELQRLNPAGARILGRPPGRLGLSLAEQVSWFRLLAASGGPIDPGDMPAAAALRGETRLSQELRVDAEDGQQRFVACSASPLSDARGRIYGAVSIFHDTTQAHEAEQEKDAFISLVSHELKTPITSIKGYAQMLLRRAEEASGNEKDLKGLRIINDEVDRMVDLINQLLDITRIETQRLQLNWNRIDLVAVTADAVDRLQMTTNRHTLRLRAPNEPVWVDGDAMRLAQVLGNLLINAIKYSPEGGPVEITVESQEGRGWVSVRDWGIGIASEDQAHIFQRFYRGGRRTAGTLSGMGLGLYISREIILRHQGDIVFHSQLGRGTTFLFWLPLAGAAEPAAEADLTAIGQNPG